MGIVFKFLKVVSLCKRLSAICTTVFLLSGCSFEYSVTDLNLAEELTVTMSSPQSSITDSEVITVDIEFNKTVSSLKPENLLVSGGTLVGVANSGNGKNFQLTVQTNGAYGAGIDKKVVEVVLLGQSLDVGKGASQAISQSEMIFVVDSVRPSVVISTSESSPTNNSPLLYNVSFDEKVQGLSATDFEVLGGGAFISGLVGDGTNYTLTLSPVVSGVISVKLPAKKIKDMAGNFNTASNEILITYDNNIPIPTLSYLGSTPTNSASLNFEVSFLNPITGLDALDFVVVNGNVSNLTGPVADKYTVTVVPSSEGLVSVNLPAGVLSSTSGNLNEASNTVSVIVDRTEPSLTISGPVLTMGNKDTKFLWTVDYSGESSIDLTGKIIIAGTSTAGCILNSVSTTGASQRTIEVTGCTGEGLVNIQIAANSAQDDAGNEAPASAVSENATVKNSSPSLTITGPTNSPGKKTSSFVWTLTYSGHDDINLSDSDITLVSSGVSNCTKVVSPSGNPRTVTVTNCDGDGTVKINVAAGTAIDTVGNLAAANTLAADAIVDNTAPTLVIGSVNPSIGNSSTVFSWVLTYDGASAVSLVPGDVTLTNLGNFTGCSVNIPNAVGNVNRTVEVSGCSTNGQVGISIASETASDDSGNVTPSVTSASLATINSSSFSLTLNSTASATNNLSSLPVTVDFSSNANGFAEGDLVVSNATISGFTPHSGTSYSFNLIPIADGAVSVYVPANMATNDFGTNNIISNTLSFNIDRVKPALSISGPTPLSGNKDTSLEWIVNYVGADSAILLDPSFVVLGGSAAGTCDTPNVVANGANSKKVVVTNCTGDGDLNISINAGSGQDLAQNLADSAGPSENAMIDNTAPILTIVGTDVSVGNSSKVFEWEVTYGDSDTVLIDNSFILLETTGTVVCSSKNVSSSGTVRTISVSSCTGNGTVNVKVAADSAQDALGNKVGEVTSVDIATVDNLAPTYTIGSVSPANGNASTDFKWNITYSNHQTIDLDVDDIVIVSTGTVSGCLKSVTSSGNPREVTISNCSGDGSVSFNLAANTAMDTAGNRTIAGNSDSGTVDNLGPSIQITGPLPASGNSASSFVWTVEFTDATSVNLSSITFIGNATSGCSAAISGSENSERTVTVSDCSSTGTVGIVVPAEVASDAIGNKSVAASSNTANVDNEPPAIFIGTPNPSIGNNSTTFVWDVVYVDANSITLSGSDVVLTGVTSDCSKSVSNVNATTYQVSVSNCTGDGAMGISIAQGTATDSVGNSAASAVGSDVTLDNTPPTLSIADGSPTSGSSATTFSWVVTYSNYQDITLAAGDITPQSSGGIVTCATKNVTGAGATRTVSLSNCTGSGQLSFTVATGTAQDSLGNQSLGATSNAVTVIAAPAITVSVGSPSPSWGTQVTTFAWTVTFTGASSYPISTHHIDLVGDTVGCVVVVKNGSPSNKRNVLLTGCEGNGTVAISVKEGAALDASGNPSPASAVSPSATLENVYSVSFVDFTKNTNVSGASNNISIPVRLNTVAPEDITVNYEIVDFNTTAVSGVDHNLVNGTVTIPAGQQIANISFNFDATNNTNRSLQLALKGASSVGTPVGVGNKQIHRHIASVAGNLKDKYISVSTSIYRSCGVTQVGSIKCWGTGNSYYSSFMSLGDGTPNSSYVPQTVPSSGPGGDIYTKVAVGFNSVCGVTNDHRLMCWGQSFYVLNSFYYTPTQIGVGNSYKDISLKNSHACAITTDNKLHCWGANSYGQLGDTTNIDKEGAPTLIDESVDYKKVSVGDQHTCAITMDNELKCWGYNNRGQLGTGSTSGDITMPTLVQSGTSFMAVALGTYHTCAITSDNLLKCWGYNWGNQVNETNTDPVLAAHTVLMGRYKDVDLGDDYTCALSVENNLYCWGGGSEFGQLGNGGFLRTSWPSLVSANIVGLAVSPDTACMIDTDNHLSCWGENTYGALGNGQAFKSPTTYISDSVNIYSQTSGSQRSNCALGTDKKVRCSGNAWENGLGQGVPGLQNYASRLEVPGLFKMIAAGDEFSCGISDPSSNLVCWGKIAGDISYTPQILDGTTTYSMVSVGLDSACAITTANKLKCWGDNDGGKLGINEADPWYATGTPVAVDPTLDYSYVSVKNDIACAIESPNGRVRCWGWNYYGQIGNGTSGADVLQPTYTSDTSSYLQVSVGLLHVCGILGTSPSTSGAVRCWGDNSTRQLGTTAGDESVPTDISGGDVYKSIATGAYGSCAVSSTGVLKCWGSNDYGLIGGATLNTTANSPTVVDSGVTYDSAAMGSHHVCGITAAGVLKCRGFNPDSQLGTGNLVARPSIVVPSN